MIWLLLLALLAGTILPIQSGVNAQLARVLGQPMLAAFVSFAVGTIALSLYLLIARPSLPPQSVLLQSPWWLWVGGLLGACFIVISIILVPKLGAAIYIALVITGQTIISMILDHYGLLGFQIRPINLWRAMGAVLLLLGVGLIRRF